MDEYEALTGQLQVRQTDAAGTARGLAWLGGAIAAAAASCVTLCRQHGLQQQHMPYHCCCDSFTGCQDSGVLTATQIAGMEAPFWLQLLPLLFLTLLCCCCFCCSCCFCCCCCCCCCCVSPGAVAALPGALQEPAVPGGPAGQLPKVCHCHRARGRWWCVGGGGRACTVCGFLTQTSHWTATRYVTVLWQLAEGVGMEACLCS
jgi:hypothetical protein